MRLTRVSVQKLFNVFDHTIELSKDNPITIIHGPNGYGKTIILRMIDSLAAGRFSTFTSIPFARFEAMFDDESTLLIDRTAPADAAEASKERRRRITITLQRRGESAEHFGIPDPEDRKGLSNAIDAKLSEFLTRAGENVWTHDHTGEVLSTEDVLDRYGDRLPQRFQLEHDRFKVFRRELKTRLIQTRRLEANTRENEAGGENATIMGRRAVFGPRPAPVESVTRYAQELAAELKTTLAEYAARSQDLDRTFPGRLLRHDRANTLPVAVVRERLHELEGRRAALTELGFLDKEEVAFDIGGQLDEIESWKIDVLSIYVGDVAKKLEVFDTLATKIRTLIDVLKAHFTYKQVSIERERGYVFHTPDGTVLPAAALSSGEQHELILAYELLFKVQSNTLILIDEPEISLHLKWQENFLGDLQRMLEVTRSHALVATHSADIIGDRWDLTQELTGP
jgi:hypothetical protein